LLTFDNFGPAPQSYPMQDEPERKSPAANIL